MRRSHACCAGVVRARQTADTTLRGRARLHFHARIGMAMRTDMATIGEVD